MIVALSKATIGFIKLAMSEKIHESKPGLVSSRSLQRAIGYGSLFLPFALLISVMLPLKTDDQFQRTMSEFVYTAAAPAFFGALFSLGIMFFAYEGYLGRAGKSPFTDRQLAMIAGAAAFVTASFPSRTCMVVEGRVQEFNMFDWPYSGLLHFSGATVLFAAMAWFCLFHFTLSDQEDIRPSKKLRNRIYQICGWLMIAGIAILAMMWAGKPETCPQSNHMVTGLSSVFYIEAVMTIAFGFAWLVKSGEFFAD